MSIVRVAKPEGLVGLPRPHALIEASAGTGKTFTIEHLVVDVLLDEKSKTTIDRMAVVTFTRKAAAEMSARIRDRLVELRDRTTGDADVPGEAWTLDADARGRLASAVANFDQAQISTIHSFCQRILDENALLTGQLRSSGDDDVRELFHDAWTRQLRRWVAPSWPAGDVRKEVVEFLLRDDVTAEKLEKWLWEARGKRERLRPQWNETLLVEAQALFLKAARISATATTESLAKDGVTHRGSANGLLARLAKLPALVDAPPGSPALQQLRYLAFFQIIKGLTPFKTRTNVRGNTLDLFQAVDALVAAMPTREAVAIHVLGGPVHGLFERRRAELGAMDSDQLLFEASRALEGEAAELLRARLRERYAVVLVDEFQDTDELQWGIFHKVFVGDGSTGRFIAVGDPKQAIYAFRGGDIDTYYAAKERLGQPKTLGGNWRSTDAMVRAYNRIIEEEHADAPLLGGGDVRYETPVKAMRPGRGLFAPDGNEPMPPIGLMRVLPYGGSVPETRDALYGTIAGEVRRLLDAKTRLEAPGEPRETWATLKPSDVMCLVTTNGAARVHVDELERFGVRATQFRAADLWRGTEAGDLADLLASLAEPDDRALRLKALRTPFIGLPLEQLADVDTLPSEDERLASWNHWVKLAGRRAWHELFADLRLAGGLKRRQALSRDGERSLATLTTLVDQAHLLARDHCPDVANLARRVRERWLERSDPDSKSEQEDDDIVPALEEDAVRVLTVFKAKGLEAPVVFVAFGIGDGRDSDNVLQPYHDGERTRVHWAGTTRTKDVDARIKQETDLERRRLQYVAITRPKARLYLPLVLPPPPDIDSIPVHPLYAHLNERLLKLEGDASFQPFLDTLDASPDHVPPKRTPAGRLSDVPAAPKADTLTALADTPKDAALLRPHIRGAAIDSFSGLKPVFDAELVKPAAAPVGPDELPRGTGPGKIIHTFLELLPLESVKAGQSPDDWRARDDVRAVFDDWWRRSAWTDAQKLDAEMVCHAGLHHPVTLPGGVLLPSIGALGQMLQREVPFHFPFPTSGVVLGRPVTGRWTVGHGWMTGSIDFAFEYRERLWFGDWKTNSLTDYGAATVEASVRASYDGQIRIYTLALMRACGIATRDQYERRFGGAVYVYLRGFDGTGQGVYTHRPTWDELLELDRLLKSHDLPRPPSGTNPEPSPDPSGGEATPAVPDEMQLDEEGTDPTEENAA